MTRSEFYEKYGEIGVVFCSYHKYTFTYSTTLEDGNILRCEVGGNPDEIYRHDVSVGSVETIKGLEPYSGSVCDKKGNVIESFYDY